MRKKYESDINEIEQMEKKMNGILLQLNDDIKYTTDMQHYSCRILIKHKEDIHKLSTELSKRKMNLKGHYENFIDTPENAIIKSKIQNGGIYQHLVQKPIKASKALVSFFSVYKANVKEYKQLNDQCRFVMTELKKVMDKYENQFISLRKTKPSKA